MGIACGSKEWDLPLSRFPLRGKAGAGGFPHAAGTLRANKKRCHASMPRLPPQEGLPPPLCIPPLASGEDALYNANRTFHLLIKPDNLTCYQHLTTPNDNQVAFRGLNHMAYDPKGSS